MKDYEDHSKMSRFALRGFKSAGSFILDNGVHHDLLVRRDTEGPQTQLQ